LAHVPSLIATDRTSYDTADNSTIDAAGVQAHSAAFWETKLPADLKTDLSAVQPADNGTYQLADTRTDTTTHHTANF
jgi:hypothetical protein